MRTATRIIAVAVVVVAVGVGSISWTRNTDAAGGPGWRLLAATRHGLPNLSYFTEHGEDAALAADEAGLESMWSGLERERLPHAPFRVRIDADDIRRAVEIGG
jgi:hypothetical protein